MTILNLRWRGLGHFRPFSKAHIPKYKNNEKLISGEYGQLSAIFHTTSVKMAQAYNMIEIGGEKLFTF